ncbi:MAG TPA: cytochrome c peroxidase [Polyangia bacterium]|jgi:cytochrome c peroxidase
MREPPVNTSTYRSKISNLNYYLFRKTKRRSPSALCWGLAVVALGIAGCGRLADDHLCGSAGCEWSEEEWGRLAALANLPAEAPADNSNKYIGNGAAETLGKKWFFDGRFSGAATLLDQLKRPVPYARAAKGATMTTVSCTTCHDLGNAGIDDTSTPGNVSIGAGWFDVNAQPTMNAAFYNLSFWNGRTDSLWAQALGATEGGVSMNSSRLHVAWVISDFYKTDFQTVFPDAALPMTELSSALMATLQTDGECTLANGACPDDCRPETDAVAGPMGCWPRFPLQGKPGAKTGCQVGDSTEPAGDAWDCMDPADQTTVNRIFVDFGKAIAAYEAKMISRNSAFDDYVAAGPQSNVISPAAQRGAQLFVGKAACSDCHNTPLFSDNGFHNIGVPQTGPGVPTEAECPAGGVCDCVETPAGTDTSGNTIAAKAAKNCLPWGARDGIGKLQKNAFLRTSVWSDDMTDMSRQKYVAMSTDDIPAGAWRTPTLRDIALTAPYMHDGVFATLEDVIDHYDRGGGAGDAVGVPAAQIRPLFLTDEDKSDLVEFLKTLTGEALPADFRSAPVLP